MFRHLKNGDVLLMNRQPTLHKPSIMAHKVSKFLTEILQHSTEPPSRKYGFANQNFHNNYYIHQISHIFTAADISLVLSLMSMGRLPVAF